MGCVIHASLHLKFCSALLIPAKDQRSYTVRSRLRGTNTSIPHTANSLLERDTGVADAVTNVNANQINKSLHKLCRHLHTLYGSIARTTSKFLHAHCRRLSALDGTLVCIVLRAGPPLCATVLAKSYCSQHSAEQRLLSSKSLSASDAPRLRPPSAHSLRRQPRFVRFARTR